VKQEAIKEAPSLEIRKSGWKK